MLHETDKKEFAVKGKKDMKKQYNNLYPEYEEVDWLRSNKNNAAVEYIFLN